MKLKCPGCSKLLQIPDTAAGKTVKCPCGKQLRVPMPKSASGQAPVKRPVAAGATATPRPAARASASPLGADAGLFDELTETDLAPVAVAPRPGTAPAAASGGGHNPYASSMTEADAAGGAAGNYASQNKRVANYILDNIFMSFMSLGIGVVVGIAMIAMYGVEMTDQQEATADTVTSGLGFGFFLFYYVAMEAIFGATLGKFITGTRVIAADGGKAGFGKIIGRNLARMIPFDPLSFLFGDKTTGWHDSISGTRVIDIRKG
ncbi:RDD family protein [Rhodopirellula sp. JC740]|uniref:RDD family protein n=1 Tax=Rhodopirellula halodulae TaxID=2894198 RepID=A0ABS8NM82_9BACT|nr:RDD family protein [Rhodopirellula sp. JC740]MCC9644682.1 RDD family protein [Rhodopirellula sp. JC740]